MFLREMGTRSRKKVLLDPDAPASTLTSHPDEFFHYELPRIITLRESARLQSFPDAFVFKGRYTLNGDRRGLDVSRCAQVGNAIPPLLGRAIGAVISRILDEMDTGTIQSLVDTAHESSGQLFVS
jgi:DNA (cytosine-5)-methyltransferase 1